MGLIKSISEWPGLTFLKNHEKPIIIIILCLAVFHVAGMGINAYQSYERTKLNQYEQQLAANAAALAQNAQDIAGLKTQGATEKAADAQIISAVTAQNAALNKIMADREAATKTQQQTDLHATIPQLSQRFMSLVPGIDLNDIKVAPDAKTVTIGQDTAEKTVAQLELVPQLQQDKKDLQTQITGMQKSLDAEMQYTNTLEKTLTAEDKQITMLENQLSTSDKACQAKLDIEKANTAKAYGKGTTFGSVLGAIGGFILRGLIK